MYKNASVIIASAITGILTLSVLAAISSTNQALAQAEPTQLFLDWGAYQACCKLSGDLLIGDTSKGVGGDTITLHGLDGVGTLSTKTESSGYYSFGTINVTESGKYIVKADFAGDSEYEPSSATTAVVCCR